MPPSESKLADDFEESKGGGVNDPVVLSLIEWGTSAKFERELGDWMQKNCEPFVNFVDAGDEQPLEWGSAFSAYCKWLDTELGEFCKNEDVSPAAVSKRMAVCLEDNKETDFFPAFMSITDYDMFVSHMHERAIERDREDAAKEALADASGEGNISGCWIADPDEYNPEAAEAALKQIACPWVFRKVLKRAAKFIKNVNIRQTDSSMEFVYNIHLFGTTVVRINYGKRCTIPNLWKKDNTVYMEQPGSGDIKYEVFDQPGIPKDSPTTHKWWLEADGDKLLWETIVYRPDVDKKVVYVQHFLRSGSKFK